MQEQRHDIRGLRVITSNSIPLIVFICSNETWMKELYELLGDMITIKWRENETTGNIILTVYFSDNTKYMSYDTQSTLQTFPQLQELKDGYISHFSTGYLLPSDTFYISQIKALTLVF